MTEDPGADEVPPLPRYYARPDPAGFFVAAWPVWPADPVQPLPGDVEVTAEIAAAPQGWCLLDGAIVPRPPPAPTRESVARERGSRYLSVWPVDAQLEAHADAAAGRPEKLAAMLADLAAIKAGLPYPGGGGNGAV